MARLIFAVLLLILAVAGVVIRKTYYYVPAHELKRQAEKDDVLSQQLYRAVAYGSSLRGFLWIFIALTSAGGFVLLARLAPPWLSLLLVIGVLWAAFSWLPASRITALGTKLTVWVTPLIARLLNYLHPLMSRSVETVQKRYSAPHHTGIFERQDLIALIERQQWQADSRLSEEELEIAKRALSFDEHTVAEIITPHKQTKTLLADDTVGPVLINELHTADQDFVLVRDSKKGPFVGVLDYRQLGLHSGGKVRDHMKPTVYYLHENDSLTEALHAFFVTNYPAFVVVNSFEEFVGIVSVDNMLRQLLGHVPGDNFDQYSDITAVAARHTKTNKNDDESQDPEDTSVNTEEEVIE